MSFCFFICTSTLELKLLFVPGQFSPLLDGETNLASASYAPNLYSTYLLIRLLNQKLHRGAS